MNVKKLKLFRKIVFLTFKIVPLLSCLGLDLKYIPFNLAELLCQENSMDYLKIRNWDGLNYVSLPKGFCIYGIMPAMP